MTAEVFIPLEVLHINDIIIHPPTSAYPVRIPTAMISYANDLYSLPKLSIFTPFFTVHSWNSSKGRLELDGSFSKLNELFEKILITLVNNPSWSSHAKTTYEEVKSKLQPFIINKRFVVYINTQKNEETVIYTKDKSGIHRKYNVTDDILETGQQIRIGIRFQGIVFLKNTTGILNYRIQHHVVNVFVKS